MTACLPIVVSLGDVTPTDEDVSAITYAWTINDGTSDLTLTDNTTAT